MIKTAHRFNPRDDRELTQVKAIELASEILQEALGVDITLQAQRQPGWAGTDAFHAGMYCHYETGKADIPRLIKINFRNLSGASTKTVLTVLGHEFRHAVQHQKGMFEKPSPWSEEKWVGPTHICEEKPAHVNPSYWRRPSEVDARAFQAEYANFVINHPKFAPYLESLNMEGDIPKKKDKAATYAKYGITAEETQLFAPSKELTCYMTLSQIGAKKWTPKVCRSVWKDHRELLMSQPFEYVMVPCDLYDLIS